MKKIILAAAFTTLSGVASAQMAEVDAEVAQNLQLAITLQGHACAQVINVEPVGSEGARITCVSVEGNDATGVFLFSVTADGLSIVEE